MAMVDHNGMSDQPIHEAAGRGDLAELKRLVKAQWRWKRRALVRCNGWFGRKPLHNAAQSGSLECVRFLLDHGADANEVDLENGLGPLHDAATGPIAKLLIDAGAKVNHVGKLTRTPLGFACQRMKPDVVEVLIAHGADVNYAPKTDRYTTMLQWAFSTHGSNWAADPHIEQSERVIKLLLEAGSRPNDVNVFGMNALHKACSQNLTYAVRLLLPYGADPNPRDVHQMNCFDHARENPEILALLEPHRRTIEEKPKPRQTPQQLIERLLAVGLVERDEFDPCTDEDIQILESRHGVALPAAYKLFLKTMGRGAGEFLVSDHWLAFFDTHLGGIVKLKDADRFPPGAFVFAVRLGDIHLFFVPDGVDEDPPIFEVSDSKTGAPAYDSFWGFFESMVEYYEFYLDPKRFSGE